MSSQIGLYYPFAKFRDEEWLKLAALYWDKLGRIIPGGYQPRDSDIVRQFKEELAFIEDFEPSGDDTLAVNTLFLSILETYGEALAQAYGIDLHSKWSSDATNILLAKSIIESWVVAIEPFRALEGNIPPEKIELDQSLAYIWPGAASNPLLSKLAELRLAVSYIRPDTGETEWWGMHPRLAFIYMAMVAEQMAANRQFHPVADDVMDHIAVNGATVEAVGVERLWDVLFSFSDEKTHLDDTWVTNIRQLLAHSTASAKYDLGAQMATIAIQSVLPKDIGNVPLKKIIKLRQQHRDEMTAFQTYIHDFVAGLEELQNINDPRALETHLMIEYEKQLKPQLDNLKNMLKSSGIDTVMGAMNVRVNLPTLVAGGGASVALAHFNPAVPMIIAAGAIAYSIFPVLREKRKAVHDILRSSPAAYLLHLQEGLEPVKLTSLIAQHVQRKLFRV
jgi:hypothetical protein